MPYNQLPVDQRVIDIDSRRFASVEKALVELITNCDDSYCRKEGSGLLSTGIIRVYYERHQAGAVIVVSDQAEGMNLDRLRTILSYGGAHSALASGGSGGRGFFGRGLKQAIFGLGHGWIESITGGRYARIDLFRDEKGSYMYNDFGGDREAETADYEKIGLEPGMHGTQVTIVVERPKTGIPYFQSIHTALCNNIYLRDVLVRRQIELANGQRGKPVERRGPLRYEAPESNLLLGPEAIGRFWYEEEEFSFAVTLQQALGVDLTLKGDERTNGLLILSGTSVLDCQFFRYENQLGTEYLFGTVLCPALSTMLAKGLPVISDDRDGLNMKEPFVQAFGAAISDMLAPFIRAERDRLSQVERATTSDRTRTMIQNLLERMNRVAVEELKILVEKEPESEKAVEEDPLRFSTQFYRRKVGLPFRIVLIADRTRLSGEEILTFSYLLPASIQVEPVPLISNVMELDEKGRLEWTIWGTEVGAKGRIGVTAGGFTAWCEIAIAADEVVGSGYPRPSGRWTDVYQPEYLDLFAGYEIRNLDNELDRAVYIPKERMIVINTGAPTVRLYVDGRGHFRDAARLLLAELFMDVMTDEMTRRYVDRSTRAGDLDAYRAAKQDLVRRYGIEIHRSFIGE
jgi:hypothetical protein